MQIHMWPRERAGELSECYNGQIRDVPYCYPQSPETFASGVEEDLAELFGFRRPEVLTSEDLIVAEEDGAIVGFLDHGLHERSEGDETKRVCVLRFMAYEPGRRAVGQALLDRAEAEYAKRGATEVAAFPKGYISIRMAKRRRWESVSPIRGNTFSRPRRPRIRSTSTGWASAVSFRATDGAAISSGEH